MPRSGNVAIFVMTMTDDRKTKPLFALPLAHAHGVTTLARIHSFNLHKYA